MSILPWRETSAEPGCRCRPTFVEPTGTGVGDRTELRVDAGDCPNRGTIATEPGCRATVIDVLAGRDAEVVRVRADGVERTYDGDAAAFLLAAGRFAALVDHHDTALAALARTDPLAAAHEATGRTGPVERLVAETGLAEGAAHADGYDDVLRPHTGPSLAQSRIDTRPPAAGRLRRSVDLATGATVREYAIDRTGDSGETGGGGATDQYHLTPVEASFGAAEYRTLREAATVLAGDTDTGSDALDGAGTLGPARAVRAVADESAPVGTLSAVLRKHTQGNGVLDDLFADERVSDVYVTAPAPTTPVRVVVDGRELPTNIRLTSEGVATLASRLRRVSGRGFSRATPRVDATLDAGPGERSVRVAGVTDPLSDGPAFAFRRHDPEAWTLPRLVATDSLTPRAAALLSLAVERGAAGLVAGARGSGKTTTLGALLWAIPRATRSVVVEDTPELPVAALQTAGRDVQGLRVARGDDETGETAPDEALRTALRLGDGALVVGEVRGEEAGVLYEAMRVGADAHAVLGTVHGDGAEAVRTRLVEDLGVSDTSFATTGFVLTMADTAAGRRVVAIEEVRHGDRGSEVATLFDLDSAGALAPTGLLDRGESVLLSSLTEPEEAYTDLLNSLGERADRLASLAENGVTAPEELRAAGADAGGRGT